MATLALVMTFSSDRTSATVTPVSGTAEEMMDELHADGGTYGKSHAGSFFVPAATAMILKARAEGFDQTVAIQ